MREFKTTLAEGGWAYVILAQETVRKEDLKFKVSQGFLMGETLSREKDPVAKDAAQ